MKKLAKKYDAFLSSEALIKQIPRLLGPGLSKGMHPPYNFFDLNENFLNRLAGKFPTPISHSEDLTNKLTEVRSTIKFQLKKVLCLGVAVGHIQMSEDQVLANVMLSACLLFRYLAAMIHALSFINRYQLPRFFAQEELAKCQVLAYQDHDGQACSTLLIYFGEV